jgi:hypothetical protein
LPNETEMTGNKAAEQIRLDEAREKGVPWKQWGPYLSERQWGTVREDYSENGDAWNYFTHDQARSRAYHWGEDGLAGFSDDHQRLCFALALWNGRDPILKERLFGLTNSEGNHGEDIKEYYFYLDSTPTHSYMKYLYKYPQHAYPYGDLIEMNRRVVATAGNTNYSILGGKSFSRGHLYRLLSNPVYIGEIANKGQLYPGRHPALIDVETWIAVLAAQYPAGVAARADIRGEFPGLGAERFEISLRQCELRAQLAGVGSD